VLALHVIYQPCFRKRFMTLANPWPLSRRRQALLCLALPLLGLASCAMPRAPTAETLWGTEWRLEMLGGEPVLATAPATLAFPEAGRVAGRGTCNRFFGAVSLSGERVRFDQMGATRMACQPDAMEQESRYLAALLQAQRMERQGDTLTLNLAGGGPPLRFVRVK
jgi:heat shock protein HslJ